MKKRAPAHASRVQDPGKSGSSLLPAPAVIIIVAVLALTTGLTAWFQNLQTVIAITTVGGLPAVELIRRPVAVFSDRRV